jgi:4-amino-4-deoxy-L-arabinose transferase-like glycosyltransferase
MGIARTIVEWMAHSPQRSFIIVFLAAFAVRGLLLTQVPPNRMHPDNPYSQDQVVAMSLIENGEFGGFYKLPTGSTAHVAPIVPGLIAGIWWLLGTTLTGGYASRLVVIAGYSAMYGMIPWVGGRVGIGRQAGMVAGLAGAVIPDQSEHGHELAAIALGLMMVAMLRRWTSARSSPVGSFLLGLMIGVSFHVQPALLSVVVGFIIFELWWSRGRRKWRLLALVVIGATLACVPWGWRNYKVFDEVFFIRSNLGLELRMGNSEGAAPALEVIGQRGVYRHPSGQVEEARLVQQLGEMEYMRRAKREALEWITAHPVDFARLTVLRFIHFWFGPLHRPMAAVAVSLLTVLALLGARRCLPSMTTPQRAAMLIPLVMYPLIYYIVGYEFRYRIPIHWIVLLLAGAEVWHWIRRR